jgi:threonine/homoserine/homoserine lactone efflux protein
MDLLLDGIKVGLILSLLIGPLFFSLVQTGVEEGIRAGTALGFGIWISDLLYITVVYWGVSYISRIADWPSFSATLGIGGSALLIFFGIGVLLKNPSDEVFSFQPFTRRTSSYATLWLKGFLINSINPFTVFFWLGLMSTVVIKDKLGGSEALYYFGGILGTIAVTDFSKVLLAKNIRRYMRPIHLLWLRRVSASALILFGLALLIRALMLQ